MVLNINYNLLLINTNNCLDFIPNNAEYYNETLNILKCKIGYYLSPPYNCVPNICYQSCELCYESSDNSSNQKCFKCKEGFLLNNDNNCYYPDSTYILHYMINFTSINNIINITCSEGEYLFEDNICYICNNTCKKYEINKCDCLECDNGFIFKLDKKRCDKCDNNCKEYRNNNCDCLSCFEGYHLYNYECIMNIKYKETNFLYEIIGTEENIISSESEIYNIYGYYNNIEEKIFI